MGDLGSIPGLGRSPGEGKGYPLQYSGLEISMDGMVHGITKSQTWLSIHVHSLLELPLLHPMNLVCCISFFISLKVLFDFSFDFFFDLPVVQQQVVFIFASVTFPIFFL